MTDIEVDSALLDAALRHLTIAGVLADLRPAAGGGAEIVLRTVAGDLALPVRTRRTASAAIGPQLDRRQLLLVPYVPETVAEAWRRNGIQFIDAAGNMYRTPGRR